MKTSIQAELPEQLVAEALRRYLKSHSTRLAESFIQEDTAWGLHGRE